MRVDEVVEKVDAKVDVKLVYDIDWLFSYIATRPIFILCPKELQPDMNRILISNQTELVHKINSNNYGKQQFIYLGQSAHHHCPPDDSHVFLHHHRHIILHRHRQSSTSANGIDQPLFSDITSSPSCCLIVGIIGHQQLPYRPVITSPSVGPSFINFPDSCQNTVSTHAPNFGV